MLSGCGFWCGSEGVGVGGCTLVERCVCVRGGVWCCDRLSRTLTGCGWWEN